MRSNTSHYNVSLTVQGKVMRRVSINHNFWRERWAEAGSRTCVLPSISHMYVVLYHVYIGPLIVNSLNMKLLKEELTSCRWKRTRRLSGWQPCWTFRPHSEWPHWSSPHLETKGKYIIINILYYYVEVLIKYKAVVLVVVLVENNNSRVVLVVLCSSSTLDNSLIIFLH